MTPCPKPQPRKKVKARRARACRVCGGVARSTNTGALLGCQPDDRLDGLARPRIDIQPLSSHGADGRLGISCGGHIHLEPERTEAVA